MQDLTHLDRLESESIHIIREVAATFERPVMLYSIGKDSARFMLHLALKAFAPIETCRSRLLHIDTTWKFKEMIAFRDADWLSVFKHRPPSSISTPMVLARGIGPFSHGSKLHTDVMKTEALKQALGKFKFDAAFGGARRDEEKSRAKERVFSFRSKSHRWDPKAQRPELWSLYNTKIAPGESVRVFPLSNWTELDVWQYIEREGIELVPLYFAARRPVVERDGMLTMVDDERMPLEPGEVPQTRLVRFRTLGCYPLTGAVESEARSVSDIILELLQSRSSERQGRAIDRDQIGSMEKKKQEGYF